MPESTQQENDQHIPASLRKSSAVSSKWNIYIICKPACQADMPSFPEILYAYRAIRMPEIFHKPYSHHTCRTSCNICISRKITINLNRKKRRSQEPLQSLRHPAAQHILYQHIPPDNLPRQLFCKIPGASARNHSADLPGSLYVFPSAVRGDSPPSRSGLPPAVERMKHKHIVQQTVEWLQITAVYIDSVAERLERKERYSYGKEDIESFIMAVPQRTEYFIEKVSILEIAQQP